MYFYLSKTIGFFAVPSNLVTVIVILGLLLWRSRYARLGKRTTIAGLVLFVIAGASPLGTALLLPLENRFPQWDATHGAPDGIVVLGGVLNPYISRHRNNIAFGPSAERLIAAVDLSRRYPDARVVFSGGNASMISRKCRNPIWRFAFSSVPGCRVTAFSSIALRAIPWRTPSTPRVLRRRSRASDGSWSPRPPTCRGRWVRFVRGVPIEAYPVDYKTGSWRDLRALPTSVIGGYGRLDLAAHEWVALVWIG